MDKKELKWYETPEVEFVATELEGFLCTSGEDIAGNDEDEEIDL